MSFYDYDLVEWPSKYDSMLKTYKHREFQLGHILLKICYKISGIQSLILRG